MDERKFASAKNIDWDFPPIEIDEIKIHFGIIGEEHVATITETPERCYCEVYDRLVPCQVIFAGERDREYELKCMKAAASGALRKMIRQISHPERNHIYA